MEKVDIEKVIYEVIVLSLALDVTQIGTQDNLIPLADSDDWTMAFIPDLEERLGVSPRIEEWENIPIFTIEQITELMYRHLSKKQ